MNEEPQDGGAPRLALPAKGAPAGLIGTVTFGFGLAAGLLMAFVGFGFLAESATIIITVGLIFLSVVALVGIVLFLLRERLLRRLFGLAETQIEAFAGPLARIAESVLARDSGGAASAARELMQRVLARYAWLTTRRWVVGSLTALIASMAALAGTALLFQQNTLLRIQIMRSEEQNALITEQSRLLLQDVQLAEAARNAGLWVELSALSADLGAAVEAAMAAGKDESAPRDASAAVTVLDPATDISRALLMRIITVSQAARPYRFLDTGFDPGDQNALLRPALEARRDAIPEIYARIAAREGWEAPQETPDLTDRPASPERGQLFRLLATAGVFNYELLNLRGLDLAFAHAPGIYLFTSTLQVARLSFADLSGAEIRQVDFGGAFLENIRLRRAFIAHSSFAAVPGALIREPFAKSDTPYFTQMSGADFSDSVIIGSGFSDAHALAALFEGALIVECDFTGAALTAGSFRRAVLIRSKFDGAGLAHADFDQAVFIGTNPLEAFSAGAGESGFDPERYRAVEIPLGDVLEHPLVALNYDLETLTTQAGPDRAWRLEAVAR
jgi:uncharacterized protein YjbI with pentapeptide repeats